MSFYDSMAVFFKKGGCREENCFSRQRTLPIKGAKARVKERKGGSYR